MLSRLRLLNRIPTVQIPLHRPILSSTTTTTTNLSSLSQQQQRPTPLTGLKTNNTRTSLPSPHHLHKKSQPQRRRLYTHATEPHQLAASSLFASPYLSVRVRCNKEVAVVLSEALLCFGANSASLDGIDSSQDLEYSWITSIFIDVQDVHTCISHAANSIGLHCIPKYEVSLGNTSDWVAYVQETFHPIEVADGLWIIPKWRTPPDPHALNILLDPGLSFGTGEHPTTKLCLLLLRDLIKGGEHFFDYGTGSGVLGIAAVKMGAAFSVGIDIDPQAVTFARQNIALNEIDYDKMLAYLVPCKDSSCRVSGSSEKNPEEETSDNLELACMKGKFDILIANILLNPLMDLAEDIVAFGKPGAVIGLSGILCEQLPQVKELYSNYLTNMSVSEMDGWACLHGTKRNFTFVE